MVEGVRLCRRVPGLLFPQQVKARVQFSIGHEKQTDIVCCRNVGRPAPVGNGEDIILSPTELPVANG